MSTPNEAGTFTIELPESLLSCSASQNDKHEPESIVTLCPRSSDLFR
jgi:hypothetical protein